MNIAGRLSAIMAAFAVLVGGIAPAFADGIPEPWGIGMQTPGSAIEMRINFFHNILLWVISIIALFVLILLIYVMARYNKWSNPKPSRTTHNVKLEVIWTLVPCLILLGLALISFPLLYYTDRVPPADVTLKVTGHQWYWTYAYPDAGNISFDSHAIWDSSDVTQAEAAKLIVDASKGWLIKNKPLRLLEVDNRVVLPVGKIVRVQITGEDVEHSWFIPSLAVNRMAVPGKLSELWIKIEKPGIYYGQCSMICGNGHGYMPIVIEGVTPEQFASWVQSKKQNVGQIPSTAQFAGIQQ
jgi:cytochrome c oxidase subunit 2